MSILEPYHFHEFSHFEFPPASRVLDVGCGPGEQMLELLRRGHEPVGIDPDPACVERVRSYELEAVQGFAEHLPFPDSSFDGVISKVVLPYTRSAIAMKEMARVLKPGGMARFSFHGAGYFLLYAAKHPNWKTRIYGLRSLVNGWSYAATGKRLPGFLGDTIYQSRTRLNRYYRRLGLELLEDPQAPTFMGFPVFIYQAVRKRPLARLSIYRPQVGSSQGHKLTSEPQTPVKHHELAVAHELTVK
ncbi:class I SAM-dependent methyltransferase [Planctopirus ephydatiae]|nr:class I SAM-dependent methyltransferase [Planctopirus ephydatiae]